MNLKNGNKMIGSWHNHKLTDNVKSVSYVRTSDNEICNITNQLSIKSAIRKKSHSFVIKFGIRLDESCNGV